MGRSMTIAAVVLLPAAVASAAGANLVVNGNFEQGSVGWSFTDANLIEEEGNHYVELFGEFGVIESTFTSEPYQEYWLTLDTRGDGSLFTVLMGDSVTYPTSSEWEGTFPYQIGNEYANQLRIMIGSPNAPASFDARVYIDNVSLVPVPEPMTISLLAFGALAVMRRRREVP